MTRPAGVAALAALLLAAWTSAAAPPPERPAETQAALPAGDGGPGPVIVVDAGHHNHHTLEERFAPFGALLRGAGFVVSPRMGPMTAAGLAGVDVLVIANALDASNVDSWALPTPSAFSPEEIAAIEAWVRRGGALLLIADHFPFPGAAQPLAAAFGFELVNGFAISLASDGTDLFTTADGTLRDHAITRGRGAPERVSAVATFTGSAFTAPPGAQPLLVLPQEFVLLLPSAAWQFDDDTPARPGLGLLQAATLRYGEGRVAVFGEAAMFTAQGSAEDAPARFGFNAQGAGQNPQFIVNTLRWLAGALPD